MHLLGLTILRHNRKSDMKGSHFLYGFEIELISKTPLPITINRILSKRFLLLMPAVDGLTIGWRTGYGGVLQRSPLIAFDHSRQG